MFVSRSTDFHAVEGFQVQYSIVARPNQETCPATKSAAELAVGVLGRPGKQEKQENTLTAMGGHSH